MKRISTLAVFGCLLCATTAHAWRHYRPFHHRVRYSPYAFGTHRSGLIPGCTRYSVHAVGHKGSGLVADWVRYTPYALGTRTNGLIVDYAGCGYGCIDGLADRTVWPVNLNGEVPCSQGKGVRETKCQTRTLRASSPQSLQRTRSATHVTGWDRHPRHNHRQVIHDYLRQRCPNDYRFTRLFKVDREYATFDVVLDDGKVIVKYWNPGMIAEMKSRNPHMAKRYDRYVLSWMKTCLDHEARGGKVYHIMSTDTDRILAKLSQALDETYPAKQLYCKADLADH